MLNPDRAELEFQPTPVSENPKKNGYIPRWLRVPAFVARMTLATLAASSTIALVDTISRIENPSTAYTSVTTPTATSHSRLVNPGFEEVDPDGTPIGWISDSWTNRAQFDIDTRVAHSGTRSAKISANYINDAARFIQRVRVLPNTNYELSGWIKTERVVLDVYPHQTFGANICLVDRTNWHVASVCPTSNNIKGTRDWTYISTDFNSGSDSEIVVAVRLGDYYSARTATGTAWFDDLQLRTKEQAAIQATATTQATRIASIDQTAIAEAQPQPTNTPLPRFTSTPEPEPTRTSTSTPKPTSIPELRPTQIVPAKLPDTPTEIPVTDWLWKVGLAFLAGLTAKELYKRWRGRIDNLTQENVNLRFSNNALVEQARRLQDEVDTLNKVGLKMHEDNKLLSAQLEESRVTVNDLKLQGSRITQENTALKADKSTLESQARKLNEQVDNLNKELERTKTEKAKGKIKFNPEWVAGQEDFERRWQAKKLPLGDDFNSVLDRFKAMIDTIHEISLDNSAMDTPKIGVRIRAGIEFVIPKVWTGKPCQKFFEKLYDKGFRTGFSNVPDDEEIAKIIYLPKQYRTLSKLSEDQIKDVRRMQRILHLALHSDRDRIYRREADPDLEDSINDLYKRFNTAWPYIDRLIR